MAATFAMSGSEERKRPFESSGGSDDYRSSSSPNKRLQLSSSSSMLPPAVPVRASNGPNGHVEPDQEEEEENAAYKGLEAFRKEAIWRQMRESRRDLARAETKAQGLERSMAEVEDRLLHFNRFWQLLVEDVRSMVAEDAAFGSQRSAFLEAIPLTVSSPSLNLLASSLQERGEATKAMLSRIVALGPSARTPEVDQMQARCHSLAEEASTLRHQTMTMQAQLQRTQGDLDDTTQRLRRAERAVDRLKSATVQAIERPLAAKEEAVAEAKAEALEAERVQALRRTEAASADAINGSSPMPASPAAAQNGASAAELEELRDLAGRRLQEATDLRATNIALVQESERLRSELSAIPDERVKDCSAFRELRAQLDFAQQEVERVHASMDAVINENAELRERREEFQQAALTEANAQLESLQEHFKARDADVVRLRGQRDDLNAELAERRQRENVKFAQIAEVKQLANAKEQRILTLKSELRRLHMTLAVKRGDNMTLEKLRAAAGGVNGEQDDAALDVLSQLHERLKAAEEASADLKRQLDARTSTTSEADLASKLSALQADLDKQSAVLSAAAEDGDGKALAERLVAQQARIASLEQEVAASNDSSNALCEEVDKLSAAYSELEKQATGKVMDLSAMEDKVLRLTTEKSKADNKYFSAMRAKDAIDNERRQALRNVERQVKVIERYAEQEKSFSGQLATHEREVSALRRSLNAHGVRIAELERDVRTARAREQDLAQQQAFAESRVQALGAQAGEEAARRARAEERVAKLERELEAAKKAAASQRRKSSAAATGGNSEEVEVLNALLRCSACKDNYRQRILVRCMHTFCTDCIDKRIQTRQRKCPHCAAPFGQDDVKPFYMQ